MGDESARRAAEEYLAAKLSAETQNEEDRLNREAAGRLATSVWKYLAETVTAKCKEWNQIAGEQVLTCRETMLGDLRGALAATGDSFRLSQVADHSQEFCKAFT